MRALKLAVMFILFGFSIAKADIVLVPDFRVDQDPPPNAVTDVASSITYGYFVVSYRYTANNYTLMARRFDLSGNPLGNAFLINTTPSSASTGGLGAGVTIDTSGNMVFAWRDNRSGQYHTYYSRFDLNQNLVNADTMVDLGSGGAGNSIASLPGGGFIIGWPDQRGVGGSIYARIYDSSGNPIGADFRVDQNPDVDANYGLSIIPVVATSPTGRIYFAWQDMRDGFPCGAGFGHIYARIFDSVGNPIGNDFRIDQSTSSAIYPTIASAPDGNFIVAWQDYRVNGCFGNQGVFSRAFDQNGTPFGNDFQVNQGSGAWQPSITCAPYGRCFIVYAGGIARHMTSTGSFLDNEFTVCSGLPTVTAPAGLYTFITAWEIFNAGNNQVWANITGPESEAYPMLSPFGLVLLGIILLTIIVVRIRAAHNKVYYLIIFFFMFTVHDAMAATACYPADHPNSCSCNTTDYEHLPPGALTMSLVHGDAAKAATRFKIFFIGEGWADADQDNFNAQVEALIESLKSNSTYAAYFDFINFYRVNLKSPESGTDVLDIPADAFYGEGAEQAFIFDDENSAVFSTTGDWTFVATGEAYEGAGFHIAESN